MSDKKAESSVDASGAPPNRDDTASAPAAISPAVDDGTARASSGGQAPDASNGTKKAAAGGGDEGVSSASLFAFGGDPIYASIFSAAGQPDFAQGAPGAGAAPFVPQPDFQAQMESMQLGAGGGPGGSGGQQRVHKQGSLQELYAQRMGEMSASPNAQTALESADFIWRG
jgi:hypothetical protein